METVLRVKHLRKSFRGRLGIERFDALKGISFEIEKGAITGFLGANGAGKTTTIKCLLGLIRPSEGEIDFFGQGRASESVRERIGYLPERPYFYEYLTGEEYLYFCARLSSKLNRASLEKKIDEVLERVELLPAKTRALRGYSKGMLQRIGIAQALIHDPEFVILDEPMSGLDPDGRFKINEILRSIANSGTTVFFSSHLLNDAEALCKNLLILSHGKVTYQGPLDGLLNRLSFGYIVDFKDGDRHQSVTVDSEGALQREIDSLRQKDKHILAVRSDRPTLEKAFQMLGQPTQNGETSQ